MRTQATETSDMASLGYSEPDNLAPATASPLHDRVSAADAGRLPTSVLELATRLQTTLETDVQIELFAREMQRQVAIEGLRFRLPESDRAILAGQEAEHRASYDLTLESRSLGTISLFRQTAFTNAEIEQIENLLCALIYPLRNALTYRRAVELASRDPLTGIGNRRVFEQSLIREMDIARRQSTPLALLMVDIDHFKRFNDRFGHAFGDDILVAVAQTIGSTIRRSDLLFRFGGEEFVVLASHTDGAGAHLLAERIRESIAAIRNVRGRSVDVTVSLGIANLKSAEDQTSLFERADRALYRAKQDGRNQTCVAEIN
jgi:diguanylate cyclase (GGDEF)-like protein